MEFFWAFVKYGLGPIISIIITMKIYGLKVHIANKALMTLLTLLILFMFLPIRAKVGDSSLYTFLELVFIDQTKYFAIAAISYVVALILFFIPKRKLQILSFLVFLLGITSVWVNLFTNPDYTEAKHTSDVYGEKAPLTGFLWITSDVFLPAFIFLLYLVSLASEKDKKEAIKLLKGNLRHRGYRT